MRWFLERRGKRRSHSAWKKRRALFAKSGLFDREWYLARNPDILQLGRDPLDHFAEHGALEGRDPGPGFETNYYVEQYPFFVETGLCPLEHYLRIGRRAGARPTRWPSKGKKEFQHLVEASGLFDPCWYLARYEDVRRSGQDPLVHLIDAGAREWRDPGPGFEAAFYAEMSPEVVGSPMSPLEHYLRIGRGLGIPASSQQIDANEKFEKLLEESGMFDAEWYLKRNPDVLSANVDPLDHFLRSGAAEWRDPGPKFETAFYIEQNNNVPYDQSITPIEHYLRFGRAAGIMPKGAPPYVRWIQRFHTLADEDRSRIEKDAQSHLLPPVLFLHIQRCSGPSSEACELTEDQIGVRLTFCSISGSEDLGLAMQSLVEYPNETVVVMAAGDMRLRAEASYSLASVLVHDGKDAAYSDHDHEAPNGQLLRPVFKPEMSPEFMAQFPFAGPLVAVRLTDWNRTRVQDALAQAVHGDPLTAFAAFLLATDRHAVKRIPIPLYSLRDLQESGEADLGSPYEVVPGNLPARPIRQFADPPDVRILIPTRDRRELLEACISSILAKTDYPQDRFRIVVIDNDSQEAESVAYLKDLAENPSCAVVSSPGPFNFSKICNAGASASGGEVLVFLNNDMTVIETDWLTELVAHAIEEDVGAVGAKLLYPDDTVQHGGVVLGIQGVGGHRLVKSRALDSRSLDATRELTAVTGACLAIRRSVFEAVGGFDPVLAVAFNDVCLCARLIEKGYRNIYVARALLYHHESKSRGFDDSTEKQATNRREAIYARSRYGALFQDDPAYSPNLSLQRVGDLGVPPRYVLPWRRSADRRRVLLLASVHGLGHGVGCVVAMQAAQFVSRGWDVTVGGPVDHRDRDYPGCRRVRLITESQAAAFAVAEGFDCVVAHTPPFFSLTRYLGARPLFYAYDHGEPSPALFEDRVRRELVDWEKRFCAPLARRVFAISKAIHQEQYRTDAVVLRNGNTHLATWSSDWVAKRQALRKKFGFEGRFAILNVCRFQEFERRYKGVDLYATLAAEARYVVPNLAECGIFVLAGRGDEEDVAHMRKVGLTVFPNVTDEEMAELYAASDLYVNLSQWEGYNLGIGQALAMGLPTIASDIPAHREFGIPTSNTVPKLCALVGEVLSRWEETGADRVARLDPWDAPLSRMVDILEEDVAADLAGRWL